MRKVKTFRPLNVVEKISVPPSKVAECDVLHVICGSPSFEAFGRPSSGSRGKTVGSDHSSNGSERTSRNAPTFEVGCKTSWLIFRLRRVLLGPSKLPDQVAEVAIGLQRLQATVEIYRGLEPFVTKDAADRFVVSRLVLKPDRSSGVSELVRGDEQASGFLDPFGDLIAQGLGALEPAGLTRKQPKLVRSAQQRGLKWCTYSSIRPVSSRSNGTSKSTQFFTS